ncbi:MAG TPA: LapA family protein [Acidimicrobiia bacterium]|jgi:uncharacterized integral membrane protein|nr:LapA family protein [Acidimicrobiia bacterium]
MVEPTDEHTTTIDERPSGGFGHDVRVVLGTALLVLLVVFAIDNRRQIHVSYIVGSTDAPLWLVLAATAVVGALIGWLILHRPHRNRSHVGSARKTA